MTSPVISISRSVGKGFVFALASLALSATSAFAQSESTGDNWSVGSAANDDTSVGLAATVNVPSPADKGPAGQHSTDRAPAPRPESLSPAQPAPANAAPAPYAAPTTAEYEDTDPSAVDVFRPELDPYGRWVDDSRYGRVWVPDTGYVGSDFAPYVSRGQWALDADNNWVWNSDYPFGWVVFHYGRWAWIDSVGWSWVPGRRYAPAWVVWRVPTDNYAYVGWAPAPPYYGWFGAGLIWSSYYAPLPFVFCPSYYVFYPHFGAYLVRDRYFASTLVRHSVWYSTAPVYGRGYASPTMARARVPALAVPSQRVSADPRALSMARPSANPSIAGRSSPSGFNASRGTAPGSSRSPSSGFGVRPTTLGSGASRPSYASGNGQYAGSPGLRSNTTAGSYSGSRSVGPRPLVESRYSGGYGRGVQSLGSLPGTSYGSQRYSAPSSSYSSPRYSSPASSYSAPRYSAPSSSYSSPRFSAPSSSYSAPRFSSPGSSYSAPRQSSPSSSFSAPSHSFSSPRSFSGGGGGIRSGGGGRHR